MDVNWLYRKTILYDVFPQVIMIAKENFRLDTSKVKAATLFKPKNLLATAIDIGFFLHSLSRIGLNKNHTIS
jgi:hypothetical protein